MNGHPLALLLSLTLAGPARAQEPTTLEGAEGRLKELLVTSRAKTPAESEALAIPEFGWPDLRSAAKAGALSKAKLAEVDDVLRDRFPAGLPAGAKAWVSAAPDGTPNLHIEFKASGGPLHEWGLVPTRNGVLFQYRRVNASGAAPTDGLESLSLEVTGHSPGKDPRWKRLEYRSVSSMWRLDLKSPGGLRLERDAQSGTLLASKGSWALMPEAWLRLLDFKGAVAAARGGASALLRLQDKDGSWDIGPTAVTDEANNDYVRVGITAFAVQALEEVAAKSDPRAQKAVERGYRYIRSVAVNEPHVLVNKPNQNVRPYALAYGLLATLRLREKTGDGKYDREIDALIAGIRRLAESSDGLDYHPKLAPRPSTIHLALLALSLLEVKGRELPKGLLDGLLKTLEGSRMNDGGFPYYSSSEPFDTDPGSAARSVLCEFVLYRAGRSDRAKLRAAVDRFLKYREGIKDILATRKPVHTGEHGWAKYYYLFGLYWTARALNELGAIDAPSIANDLGKVVVELKSGEAWTDSPDFGGPAYGTAAAMLTLVELREVIVRHWPILAAELSF